MRFTEHTVVTNGSCVKRVLTRGDVKVEKDIVTFNEEEDEDILVEEGPQIQSGTVFFFFFFFFDGDDAGTGQCKELTQHVDRRTAVTCTAPPQSPQRWSGCLHQNPGLLGVQGGKQPQLWLHCTPM